MKTIKLKGHNNYQLVCYVWDKVENPLGVVQIVHGMQEHARRYDEVSKHLNSVGLIVFASDLRGHGQTAMLNNSLLGYSDGDIFNEILLDQIIITDYLTNKYKLPITLFAHSFGSFVAQRYIIENGFKIKNVILSGSTYTNSINFRLGNVVSRLSTFFRGKKRHAKLIEKMSTGKYGKQFSNGNWLSSDDNVWQAYQADELCGRPFPNSFYLSMFKNGNKNYVNLKNIPYFLPILLINGTDDPMGSNDGIVKLFFTYGKARKKVFFKTYLNSRHEILNDINKTEVYKDVGHFALNNKLDYISMRF